MGLSCYIVCDNKLLDFFSLLSSICIFYTFSSLLAPILWDMLAWSFRIFLVIEMNNIELIVYMPLKRVLCLLSWWNCLINVKNCENFEQEKLDCLALSALVFFVCLLSDFHIATTRSEFHFNGRLINRRYNTFSSLLETGANWLNLRE